MRITQEHVGQKIAKTSWNGPDYVIVTAVGEHCFLAKNRYNMEYTLTNNDEFVLYADAEKPSIRILKNIVHKSFSTEDRLDYHAKIVSSLLDEIDALWEKVQKI